MFTVMNTITDKHMKHYDEDDERNDSDDHEAPISRQLSLACSFGGF